MGSSERERDRDEGTEREVAPASERFAGVYRRTCDRWRRRSSGASGGASDGSSAPPPHRPSTSLQRRHVILFLAANPCGSSRLALEEECTAIEHELRMTNGRGDFDFRSKWAVTVDDMMRCFNELQPTIIHFSGHGGPSVPDMQREPASAHRDAGPAAGAGIQLQGAQRQPQHVRARALTDMIESAAPSARVVVLNACFSDVAAAALCGVVDCVVGMPGAIADDAARSFAVGFYRALGYRKSVGNAVAQANAALTAKQLIDEYRPVCRTRTGISADHVILPSLD